ncbi:MAG: aromatic amino acid transport family protein [Candidatus Roizmanbacteria bacterium]
MSPLVKNTMLLLGSIIGAGILSLPIVLTQSGWLVYIFYLVALGFLLSQNNKMYREIVDASKTKHQLSGYVQLILGKRIATLSSFLHIFSNFGALLAYLILGGTFIGFIFAIPSYIGTIIFYTITTIFLIYFEKWLRLLEVYFTFIKIALILCTIIIGINQIDGMHIFALPAIGHNPIITYGVILFALNGFTIIPELQNRKDMNKSIYIAEILAVTIYIFFAFTFAGRSQDDFFNFPSREIGLLFSITGFFLVLTPYLLISWVNYDSFTQDHNFSKSKAHLIGLLVPAILFLIGITSFLQVISITGGIFFGSIGIIISIMYLKKFPRKKSLIVYLNIIIMVIGMIQQIYTLF